MPAAIAVVRVSGPAAVAAATALAGPLPAPRRAELRVLRDGAGRELDRALVLAFPGPETATGEDLVELHLHGGRAVVRAVTDALSEQPGLRAAEAGEFTRRALANGRIDLTRAEGLADLLAAETEAARRAALAAADGAVSRRVADWTRQLLMLSAQAEALIDFADEDDVVASDAAVATLCAAVAAAAAALAAAAAAPPVERLHDGIRVVFAGPPNAGKSSLVNALAERDVAIVTSMPGTTRDRIDAPVVRDGVAWILTDVAGIRDDPGDSVEAIGIAHAEAAIVAADLVVWLGDAAPPDAHMIAVHPRCDLAERATTPAGRLAISAATGTGVAALWHAMALRARDLIPRDDRAAFNRRQASHLSAAAAHLQAAPRHDLLLIAEHLRLARRELARLTGSEDVEQVLEALFSRFCIGK